MWGKGDSGRLSAQASEFPALKLLDFPQRVPTLSQVTIHSYRPWSSGFPAESGWAVPALLKAKETAQSTRVYPVPPPPQPYLWLGNQAGW